MNKGHTDDQSMLDLEKGGVLSDEDEFRGFNKSSSNNKGGSKRKLDKLRSGSLNIYGRIYKEGGKSKDGSSSKRPPPKPPRPPRGPDLDDADMKFIKEISEVSKVKHARIERLKSIKSKGAVDKKKPGEGKSSANVLAMVVTVVFFVIIVFQGMHSR